MPRGRKTVYGGMCSECRMRICTVRITKAKKPEFRKLEKFCPTCGERMPVKLTEEKHG